MDEGGSAFKMKERDLEVGLYGITILEKVRKTYPSIREIDLIRATMRFIGEPL